MGAPRKPRAECLMCGKSVKRFGKKYCSRECFARQRVIPILERRTHRECPVCHMMFSKKPALMDRGRRYCSKACSDKALVKIHTFLCSGCGEQKESKDFYVDRRKKRGYVSKCRTCYSRIATTITALKPYRRESSFISGATRRGLPYELTKEQFMSFWQKPCSYCGDQIETIGLDRIDNSMGYTIENVTPCCKSCNALKSNMNAADFVNRCGKVYAYSINTFSKHPAYNRKGA